MKLHLVVTCGLGLEELLAEELRALLPDGHAGPEIEKGAVTFRGGWHDCWRANWRLRTANRVLLEVGRFPATSGPELTAGARALVSGRDPYGLVRLEPDLGSILHPDLSFSVQATTAASEIRDTRWAALTLKDGLVDGQRDRYGRRSNVERDQPDLRLRLRLLQDEATVLIDTSGEPLDRRGYRQVTTSAPVREQLAAACILASGWDGKGPVVDPMCGSGTLLIEAGWYALGWAPGRLRATWGFEALAGFDRRRFQEIQEEAMPAPGPEVHLAGNDRSTEFVRAARTNLAAAGLGQRSELEAGDAFQFAPPAGPGLVVINPPYGERLPTEPATWKALGDLLKNRYRGYKAVILAGGEDRGKHIGLRPRRRLPVMNGPLESRILLFDLY
jgi:putative N6-adenine-specific DNA methylase